MFDIEISVSVELIKNIRCIFFLFDVNLKDTLLKVRTNES